MEPKFQTSFIPKKPIVTGGGAPTRIVHSTNIFSLAATIIFLVTVIISGGLFVYQRVILSQIDTAKKSIAEAEGAIEPAKIKELIDANSRIMSAKNLLDNHIASSQILLLLHELTIKRMKFNQLMYKNNDNKVDLTIVGEVQTYNALAQQEQIFKENEYFINPEFTNFTLAENGTILVDFATKLDPSLISYKKAVETQPAAQ